MQTIAGHPLSQAVVRAIASQAVSAAMVLCLSLIVFSDRTRAQNAPQPPNPAFEKIEDRPGLPRAASRLKGTAFGLELVVVGSPVLARAAVQVPNDFSVTQGELAFKPLGPHGAGILDVEESESSVIEANDADISPSPHAEVSQVRALNL